MSKGKEILALTTVRYGYVWEVWWTRSMIDGSVDNNTKCSAEEFAASHLDGALTHRHHLMEWSGGRIAFCGPAPLSRDEGLQRMKDEQKRRRDEFRRGFDALFEPAAPERPRVDWLKDTKLNKIGAGGDPTTPAQGSGFENAKPPGGTGATEYEPVTADLQHNDTVISKDGKVRYKLTVVRYDARFQRYYSDIEPGVQVELTVSALRHGEFRILKRAPAAPQHGARAWKSTYTRVAIDGKVYVFWDKWGPASGTSVADMVAAVAQCPKEYTEILDPAEVARLVSECSAALGLKAETPKPINWPARVGDTVSYEGKEYRVVRDDLCGMPKDHVMLRHHGEYEWKAHRSVFDSGEIRIVRRASEADRLEGKK